MEAFPKASETFISGKIAWLLKNHYPTRVVDKYKASRQYATCPPEQAEQFESISDSLFPSPNVNYNRLARLAMSGAALARSGVTNASQLADVLELRLQAGRGQPHSRSAESAANSLNSLLYWSLCHKYSIGVAHVHFGFNAIEWIPVKRAFGDRLRLVVSLLGIDLTQYPVQYEHIYDQLFQVADCFIVSSVFLKNIAVKLGCPEDRIFVHPVEVDTTVFTPAVVPKKDGKLTILSTGRLVAKKGYDTALKSVAALRQLVPDLEFQYKIIGAGELEHELKRLVEYLGLSDRVVMLGLQPHQRVREEMQNADIFFMPSFMEELGGSALEASACGVPVVASRVGGLVEAVKEGHTGLMAERDDCQSFAQLLLRLIENHDLAATLGRNGRDYVENGFSAKLLYPRLPGYYWPQ